MAVTGDEGNYLTVNTSSTIQPGDNGMLLTEVFPGF